MTLENIANDALGKIGGAGDQVDGDGFVTAAQLTADDDRVSKWINDKYPIVRKKIYTEFAAMKTPFKESVKFADLGDELKQDDLSITDISVSGSTVTVTTSTVHERTTGDTVFLADIQGDLVVSLNGTTKTITVVSTTTFTLDSVTGTSNWDHTANTGIVSKVPETGAWQYAYTIPSDYLAMVRQIDQIPSNQGGVITDYQQSVIVDKDSTGLLLLTNTFTNLAGDSAYIEYVIDQETFALFTPALNECLAVLLAAELCPIIGRDMETRQALLAEYENLTVPAAQRDNQSQGNVSAHHVKRYDGRDSDKIGVVVNQGLGTYVGADGDRRTIYR